MDSRDPLRPLPETQAALDELNDLSDPDVAHLLEDLGRRVSDIAPDVVGLSRSAPTRRRRDLPAPPAIGPDPLR